MQNRNRIELARNVLVLAALVGVVLFSWLLGHVLRYSIPALWHPPVQETDPQTKFGDSFEFEGIRHFVALPGLAPVAFPAQSQITKMWTRLPGKCAGNTYYTSLPAKCRTVDGKLVEAGDRLQEIILVPGNQPGK